MVPFSLHKRPRPHFPLHRILRERRISQYALAKKTRISTTYLNRVARGKASPTWKVVMLIAQALDLNLGDLAELKL